MYHALVDSGLDTPAPESQQILQTTRTINALDWLPILKASANIGKAEQGMPLGTTVHFRCRTEIEGVWEENDVCVCVCVYIYIYIYIHTYIQLKDVDGGSDKQGNSTVFEDQYCQ